MEVELKNNQFCQLGWSLSSQKDLRIIRVVIGHLIIQNYRTFKFYPRGKSIILYKSHANAAEYLYFKVIDSLTSQTIQQLNSTIAYITNFTSRVQPNIKIILITLKDTSYWQLNEEMLNSSKLSEQMVSRMNLNELMLLCGGRRISLIYEGEQCEMRQCGASEFARVKTMIHNYIDTYGKNYKGNAYAEIMKEMGGGDIQIILNTVALVLYEQSLEKKYNQVQSASWTTFARKRGERISADRKDIILTGGGEFLLMDLVFFVNLNNYKDQNYEEEAQILLQQSMNLYSKAIIKVVHITESLQDNFTFQYKIHPVYLRQYL